MRAMTISRLIQETSAVFEEKEVDILSGEFDQALTEIIPSAENLEAITSLSVKKYIGPSLCWKRRLPDTKYWKACWLHFRKPCFIFIFVKKVFRAQ